MEINVSMVHQDGMLPNVTDSCDGRFQTLQPDFLFKTETPATKYLSDFVTTDFQFAAHMNLSFADAALSLGDISDSSIASMPDC